MSINKVILLGRLGKDVELKQLSTGTEMATFSLATTKTWTDSNGKKQEKAAWHNIKVWGKLAVTCHNHLTKGSQAYVEGEIEYNSYEKDGTTKTFTNIIASSVVFVGGSIDTTSDKRSGFTSDDIPF